MTHDEAQAAYNQRRFLHEYDPSTGMCACPNCVLAFYMNTVIYGSQKLASPEVMREYPSSSYRGGAVTSNVFTGPNGAVLPLPSPPRLTTCPMHDTFGFCIYGKTCLLSHAAEVPPVIAPPTTLQEAESRLHEIAQEHMANDVWSCGVCAYYGITDAHMTKVGETYSYRYCPNCSIVCYMPFMLHYVELLVDAVGDDYQLYKSMVDRLRGELPHLLRVPLTYEAHRMATTIFAWSLVSPADAKFALDVTQKHFPDINAIASVGSGTGYVEHVFNRVANGVAAVPRDIDVASCGKVAQRSSFDGVLSEAHLSGKKALSFFAFDEIIRPAQFSVSVNIGAPNVLLSLDCPRVALLLSWPPFGSPEEEQSSMGYEALRHYYERGGRCLIYVGDVSSTGDWRFHAFVHQHFQLVKDYYVRNEVRRWCPQEMGLVYAGCDTIGVYKRRNY